MTVHTKIFDENGILFFESKYDVNKLAIIAEAKDEKKLALIKEKGAKWAFDGLPIFASELIKTIKNQVDEEKIEYSTFNLIHTIWLVQSTFGGLTREKFVKSDIELQILDDGTISITYS
ncbi:hypothetical protein OGY18_07935 [Citrobacter sp. Cpo142]|jgi:hypothetical protein|uniref:Uncharacterized protein n=1 Tax=Actinomadura monticuli TaxID=3097367 RepID=A0ABV4QN62_9ACTN|nr:MULTISPECIES: hypothetical protein [Citrobacter]EKY1506174.1 hypothetical protein [Enterobacter cloacae]OQD47765.1 hypothetical protein BWZ29_20150 [Enterobacter cancerogenus]HBA3575348.1 hypothetical protein [Escherichia coli]HCT8088489.1 hypothetical protein [Enterobacter hormaechei]HED2468816.1 hypothetical protein [Enterobacter mori]